ncbi:MAG: hypothetical protein IPM32_14700 [Ignavibacteriae bacterium]|nr:hypothetical protein [Ignavibacteriota bacterium]
MNEFISTIDNQKILIKTSDFSVVEINEQKSNCEISKLSEFTYKVEIDNKIFHVTVTQKNNNKITFLIDGHYIETSIKTLLEEKAENYLRQSETNNSIEEIFSPMPGLILKVYKNIYENVNQGEPIILLEAMKMENEIHSPKTGKIKNILIKPGNSVEKNQLLLTIE